MEIRPSTAGIWTACAGSIRLSVGLETPESPYAEVGSAWHEAAAFGRTQGVPVADLFGREFGDHVIDHEAAEVLDIWSETLDAVIGPGDLVLIEQPVTLSPLNPPVPLAGTADALVYSPSTRRLTIADLKTGAGVAVAAAGNPQLTLYAAGGSLLPEVGPVAQVELVIVQPRAPHPGGLVRREVIDAFELVERTADLIDAAARTLDPDASLTPGSHCKFCPANGCCPALRGHALAVAQIEFDRAPLAPPDPATLEPDELGRLLEQADLVELWIRSLRAHAHRELEVGHEVPGWKLVRKRAVRRWRDEAAAAGQLEALGLDPEEIFARTLRSPAQVEKILGRKRKGEIGDLIVAESSGSTLAPENDQRRAITSRHWLDAFETV